MMEVGLLRCLEIGGVLRVKSDSTGDPRAHEATRGATLAAAWRPDRHPGGGCETLRPGLPPEALE